MVQGRNGAGILPALQIQSTNHLERPMALNDTKFGGIITLAVALISGVSGFAAAYVSRPPAAPPVPAPQPRVAVSDPVIGRFTRTPQEDFFEFEGNNPGEEVIRVVAICNDTRPSGKTLELFLGGEKAVSPNAASSAMGIFFPANIPPKTRYRFRVNNVTGVDCSAVIFGYR